MSALSTGRETEQILRRLTETGKDRKKKLTATRGTINVTDKAAISSPTETLATVQPQPLITEPLNLQNSLKMDASMPKRYAGRKCYIFSADSVDSFSRYFAECFAASSRHFRKRPRSTRRLGLPELEISRDRFLLVCACVMRVVRIRRFTKHWGFTWISALDICRQWSTHSITEHCSQIRVQALDEWFSTWGPRNTEVP